MDDYRNQYHQPPPDAESGIRPLPDTDMPPVEKFDPEFLPESIRGFVVDAADRMQAPIDFIAVASLVGAGALIGRKATIQPKQYDNWTLAPNQWGMVVGRPSAMKSPAISAALKPIRTIEQEMQANHKAALQDMEIERRFMTATEKARKQEWEKVAKIGDKARAAELMAQESALSNPPPEPRILINSQSSAKLGDMLAQSDNGLLMERDELAGWLAILSGKDGGEDRAFYLELYDRLTPYTHSTIGRGLTKMDHPILSIVGSIQPSKVGNVVKDAVSGTADDGLIQRFQLAVWPDGEEQFAYVDRVPEARAYARYMDAMRGLAGLPLPEGEATPWKFTSAAQPMWVDWYTATNKRARGGEVTAALESHLIKSPKSITGLALEFELLDGGTSGTVGEVATMRALAFAEYLESHANRLYCAGQSGAIAGARVILDRKDKLPDGFSARDVWKKSWRGVTQDNAEDALDLLIDHGYLAAIQGDTGASGRPTIRFGWRV